MTSDQHAQANPQQVYDNLSNEIADVLLGPDSPVRGNPEFDESIAEHDRLLIRQAELKTLDTKLVEILPGLEQTEARLTEAAKQLAAENKRLTGFAGELGKAAFAGLRAGELPDHPLFADRKELQSRVESLQRQKAELVAGENAGMMEKAKVQAQQLKLTGQIKVEELKIGSLDRALGTALLTSKEMPPVQCGQSEEVLKAIADQRELVAAANETVEQAEQAVAGRKSAAAETLGRSTVNNADSLKSELKETRKEHRQNEKAIISVRDSVIAMALAADSLREEAIVGEKLKQLWSLNFDLEANKSQGMKLVDESVSRFKRLPTKVKYGAYGVAGVVLLLMAMSFFGGGGNGGAMPVSEEEIVEATKKEIPEEEIVEATKEEVTEEEIVEATEEEVTEAIAAITALGGKAERGKFGGVFGILDNDTVDSDLKTLKGLTGLKELDLSSTEITDAGLVHLKGLTRLEHLQLNRTEITDAGLVHLKGLTELRNLWLVSTPISSDGLVHLKGLSQLEILNLSLTDVGNFGVVHLKELSELRELYLGLTRVSDSGLVHLKGLKKLEVLSWNTLTGRPIIVSGNELQKLLESESSRGLLSSRPPPGEVEALISLLRERVRIPEWDSRYLDSEEGKLFSAFPAVGPLRMGMPMKQLPEYFTVLNPEADDLRFEPEVQLAATSGKLPRVVFPEYVDSVVVYFAGNVLYKVTYKIPLVYSDLSDELLAKLNLSRNGSRADCVELEKKIKSDAASRYVPTSAMFTDLLNLELTPGRTLNSAEIDTLGTAMVLKGAVAAGTRIVQVAGGIKAPAIYENHNGKDGVYWQLFRKGGLFVAMNGKGWERIGSPASSGGAVYRKWITVEHIWEPFVDAYGDSYSLMKVSELGNKWRKLLPQ